MRRVLRQTKDPITGDYTVHTHAFVKTEAVAASCAAPGTEAYWTCSVCGKLFSDEAGANEIAAPVIVPQDSPHACKDRGGGAHLHKGRLRGLLDLQRVRQAVQRREWRERDCCAGGDVKTAHTPVAAWSSRRLESLACVQCVRRKLSQGTHTFGEWHTTLAPTATKTGVQEKKCTVAATVCATVLATGTSTPQTGDPFNVWLFVGLLCIGTTGLVVLTGVQLKKHRARQVRHTINQP